MVKAFKEVFPGTPVVYVDAGNFAAVGMASAAVRNEGMIDGLNRMGYAAVMLGERELSEGHEAFLAMRKQAKFPFVSANFVYEDTLEPVVDPYVIREVTHGETKVRVGLLGLTRYNTGFLKATKDGRNIIVASPMERAKKVVPELRARCDLLVLLTGLSISQARQLAVEVPGIDLIVGANGGVLSQERDEAGGVPIVYTGNQGKHLSEIRVFKSATEGRRFDATRRHHYLNKDYPGDDTMQKHVLAILARENDINREMASAEVKRPAVPAGTPMYLGTAACSSCHEEAHEVWKSSAHAHAFRTLIDQNQDFNEECVGCHSVGFGRTGGFVNAKATPILVDVQCEACHGPGSAHVEKPGTGYGTAGARSCLRCHDPENSPEFDFYAAWPAIKH
jgi:hypothetical protein